MRRLFAPIVASALVLATAGVVLAWVQPTLTAQCAPDENSYAWSIHLHSEGNYNIDWSFDSNFASFTTTNFGSAGDHDFTTPRGGPTLYVRWTSDHGSKAQAAANGDLCQEESVAESVQESVAESVQESVAESVQESVAESVQESVAESVQESVAESVQESVAESVQESVAESVQESVAESAEQSVEAGTGTPEASTPDSAVGGHGGNPLPTVLFSLVLIGSLGALAFTNVKLARVSTRDR